MKPITTSQTVLAAAVAILALFACLAGLAPGAERPGAEYAFTSIFGDEIQLQGAGLYAKDSRSFASQAKAQDLVTLIMGVPLLLVSLFFAKKGGARGGVLLAGTFAYFTYTYTTYAFGVFYNPLFLVYVALFSMSTFGLILSLIRLDAEEIKKHFRGPGSRKAAIAFNFFAGSMIFLMWMGRILPNLLRGANTTLIDHYTTLPIQVLDLGLVVPLAFLSGILLAKNKALGYLLTGLFLMKGLTLALALGSMILWTAFAGLPVNPAETVVFAAIILAGLSVAAAYLKAIR